MWTKIDNLYIRNCCNPCILNSGREKSRDYVKQEDFVICFAISTVVFDRSEGDSHTPKRQNK